MTNHCRTPLVDAGELARMLNARVQALVTELLPDGKREHAEWSARCPWRGDGSPGSFKVHLTGGKAGVWKDFASGEKGDAFDLVAMVLYGGDKKEAFKWARRWLGIEQGDPRALERVRRQTPEPAALAKATTEEQEEMRNAARRIWMAASPQILDTPIDHYLAGRGIELRRLGKLPGAIRYHPGLYHKPSGKKWPAMVTAICHPEKPLRFAGIHRTWLDGGGTAWRKAPVDPKQVKMCLGDYRGGHIPLARGASGKSLKDAPADSVVDITEGIEDGLSVALADPTCRVLAAVSLSNMAGLVLPPAVTEVRLWLQNDEKAAALAAADRAVHAHLAAGRAVLIPNIPKGVKDVNDLLRGSAA